MSSPALTKPGEPQPSTTTEAPLRTWQLPNCPFSISCDPAVLHQIRRQVENGLHAPRGETEIGGVLFGIHQPGEVQILASRPLRIEYSFGLGFILSEQDEKRLQDLIASSAGDPALVGFEVLGWYHSHVRSRIFLSPRDSHIHLRHFGAPHQIALVIHPSPHGAIRAGFFFCEEPGNMRTEKSHQEFALEPAAQSAPDRQAAAHAAPAPTRRSAAHSAKPVATACPRCGSLSLRRSRRKSRLDQCRGFFGYYPYRCAECLTRSFLKTSTDLLDRLRANRAPSQKRRGNLRSRREMLIWSAGILSFLALLYYLVRDPGSKGE